MAPYKHPHLVAIERVARGRRKLTREWLPLDVPAFVLQVKTLPIFQDCPRSIKKTQVKLIYAAFATGGRAHGNRLARIRVSPSADIVWILATIVHELVHCALPSGVGHNERFRRTLARAVRELWGLELDPNPTNERGRVLTYALDHNIDKALHEKLDAGTLTYPLRALPTDEERTSERKAASAERVEQRAQHAARMLARAETRLKRARTLHAKWATRVRRYEKLAAKRGDAS